MTRKRIGDPEPPTTDLIFAAVLTVAIIAIFTFLLSETASGFAEAVIRQVAGCRYR